MQPLSKQATQTLVSEILQKVAHIPTPLQDLVVNGAEGNPFYVEELIKMLIEDQVILRGEDHWQVELERLAEVRVPPTLTGVLQARLDSLPPREKTTLQRASVVGRKFWDSAVEELADSKVEASQVDYLLKDVCNRELIYQREHSTFSKTDEYIFKHAILRDVTYETVLLKLRREYHQLVAKWLEDTAGERLGEYLGLIAGHYELAGAKEKAADYLRRAGEEAMQVSAFRDAIRASEHALTLLPTDSPNRVLLFLQIGKALLSLSDYTTADQYLKKALRLADQLDDQISRAKAFGHLGVIAREQGHLDEARAQLEESLALSRQVNDTASTAHALHNLGWVDYRQGKETEAKKRFIQGLQLCQALGDRTGQARALNGLGVASYALTDYDDAQSYLTESLAVYRGLGDRLGEAVVLNNLGEIARLRENYAIARDYYQKTLEINREIGEQLMVATGLVNLGHVAIALEDHHAAPNWYLEAVQMSSKIGAVPIALESLAGLAEVLAQSDAVEPALEILGLVLHHPAIDGETQLVAEPILESLCSKVPSDITDAALERGKGMELETVIAELLASPESSDPP
jgi:predicted ATPase